MNDIERRYKAGALEVRSSASRTIGGYGAVFGKPSNDLGGFYEVIDSRAFNMAEGRGFPGLQAYFNHDNNIVLGTVAGGTLRAKVDDTGLSYEVDLPRTREDILELVQRGDINKSSFAFRVTEDGQDWEWDEARQMTKRILRDVQLYDVSPVTVPAYPDASVGLRSLAAHKHMDVTELKTMVAKGETRKLFVATGGKQGHTKSPNLLHAMTVMQKRPF